MQNRHTQRKRMSEEIQVEVSNKHVCIHGLLQKRHRHRRRRQIE